MQCLSDVMSNVNLTLYRRPVPAGMKHEWDDILCEL